jgi:hypothetical protein
LTSLLAEDLVHIHGNGHVDDKAAYLDGVANKYKWYRLERSALNIRIYGETAIVTGRLSQALSIKGNEKVNDIEGFLTQTWVRAEDGWKQNTHHVSVLSLNGKPLS